MPESWISSFVCRISYNILWYVFEVFFRMAYGLRIHYVYVLYMASNGLSWYFVELCWFNIHFRMTESRDSLEFLVFLLTCDIGMLDICKIDSIKYRVFQICKWAFCCIAQNPKCSGKHWIRIDSNIYSWLLVSDCLTAQQIHRANLSGAVEPLICVCIV